MSEAGRMRVYRNAYKGARGRRGRATQRLYESGRERGIEFQTDVGPIDILATSTNGDFYVLELKLGRGPDAALGKILRYMGWVAVHLAGEKKVHGVVLASDISKKLRYAATQVPSIKLMEYELRFALKSVDLSSAL